LLDSAKQIATAHRETQRLAALQTDLDMIENGENIAAALELQEEEARNSAVEALEEAIRKGLELDEAEEQQQESQRREDEDTAQKYTANEKQRAEREVLRLRLVAAADEVVAGEISNQVKREEKRVVELEERSQKLVLKVLAKEDYGVAMQLAREIEEQERKMEIQWEADRRLARQIANVERTDNTKHEKAEAQDRVMARKLSKELNGAEESSSSRSKLRTKLGNMRSGLSELTNKMAKSNMEV